MSKASERYPESVEYYCKASGTYWARVGDFPLDGASYYCFLRAEDKKTEKEYSARMYKGYGWMDHKFTEIIVGPDRMKEFFYHEVAR